jgi:NADH:ubiquinone oxidoreductase subunit 6 (subunit J)
MNTLKWINYLFILTAATCAVSIIFIKNLFKAALLLMVILLCIAAIYILAYAEFLAVSQILIYAGGVVVIILFGIMLTAGAEGKPLQVGSTNRVSAMLLGGALMYLLGHVLYIGYNHTASSPIALDSITYTGLGLMTSHLLAFEIAGILLLIALIGAAVISSHQQDRQS